MINTLKDNIFKAVADREIEKYGRVLGDEERDVIVAKEMEEETRRAEEGRRQGKVLAFLETVPPRYKDSTFDNFEGYEDKIAFLKQGKSALIFGGNGTGKTHLGFASCRYFAEQGKDVRFVLAYKFFEDIKESFGKGNTKQVLARYSGYDYLVIDEIDKAYGSQTEFVHLYYLVNERYNFMRSTVLITNATDLVEQVGTSVLDRIASDGAIIEMKGENYRQKN
jgi:DNA replication protein DnaC